MKNARVVDQHVESIILGSMRWNRRSCASDEVTSVGHRQRRPPLEVIDATVAAAASPSMSATTTDAPATREGACDRLSNTRPAPVDQRDLVGQACVGSHSALYRLVEPLHHVVDGLLGLDLAQQHALEVGQDTVSPQLDEPANAGAGPPNFSVSIAAW